MKGRKKSPRLADWHLWSEVTRSVSPLPGRAPEKDEPEPNPAIDSDVPARGESEKRLTARPQPAAPAPNRPDAAILGPIEPKLRKRLVRGHLPIDAKIDLHGLRQAEAHAALIRFVTARAARGDRTLLIITGKGLSAKPETGLFAHEREVRHGVLRAMLPVWLSEPALRDLVAGLEPATRAHGGEGAFYLRLKRPRA